MEKIGVLITCHNRKQTTIRCLRRLYEIYSDFRVYLVDDGSSDGTADDIQKNFPDVYIISGNGSLFWSRGMHLAWSAAAMSNHDYYLWLNDDVILKDYSINELLDCSIEMNDQAIISGIVGSHDGKNILYGGTDSNKKLLLPNGIMQSITNMNGNIVLVPRSVYEKVGNIDSFFHHDIGDVDYGLRAKRLGFGVYTSRIVIGDCDVNYGMYCRVRLQNSSLFGRFKKLYSPLGGNPLVNFYFRRRHYGLINAVVYFIYINVINIVPDRIVRILFGDRYVSG